MFRVSPLETPAADTDFQDETLVEPSAFEPSGFETAQDETVGAGPAFDEPTVVGAVTEIDAGSPTLVQSQEPTAYEVRPAPSRRRVRGRVRGRDGLVRRGRRVRVGPRRAAARSGALLRGRGRGPAARRSCSRARAAGYARAGSRTRGGGRGGSARAGRPGSPPAPLVEHGPDAPRGRPRNAHARPRPQPPAGRTRRAAAGRAPVSWRPRDSPASSPSPVSGTWAGACWRARPVRPRR